jgi:demethylmenaquinone methyltransferase / 2-methoxy-6-polyprenyl-1,4-benzoquinol methylase
MVARVHPAAEIHALDISPEMLAVGRRRAAAGGLGRIGFIEGDATALPFGDEHFDVVLAAFGLHELPHDVRARALQEVVRVLRPGGRLLAVDLDAPRRRSGTFSAYIRWVEKPSAREVLGPGLTRQAEEAGFDIFRHVSVPARPLPFQLVEAVPAG